MTFKFQCPHNVLAEQRHTAACFVWGSFYAMAAVLSSCDREHMAHKTYRIYLLALYSKASLQSSGLGGHTQVLVSYNSKRPLLKFHKIHKSSEEVKITSPGGQEGRLPGGSGQDVEAGRMERSPQDSGTCNVHFLLLPSSPPPPTPPMPSSCPSHQRRELGKGLCWVITYFSKLTVSHLSFSFSCEGCWKGYSHFNRGFPKIFVSTSLRLMFILNSPGFLGSGLGCLALVQRQELQVCPRRLTFPLFFLDGGCSTGWFPSGEAPSLNPASLNPDSEREREINTR